MSPQQVLVWSLVATACMLTVFELSHGFGMSRLNLPLLFGAYFTPRRSRAALFGLFLYVLGGWLFALLYVWIFTTISVRHWAEGLLIGFFHGVVLLVVVLPVLPYVHPRMATEYDKPTSRRRLEPPGFIGLHYGLGTPLTALLAHSVYGLVIAIGYLRS